MAMRISALLSRHHPYVLRAPPWISACLIFIGLAWLALLPLDAYSRRTYISENALLPGQVHTYFGGSEGDILNAYRREIESVEDQRQEVISSKLEEIFLSASLEPSRQRYRYRLANGTIEGENVYAIIEAPRGDATEAMVLLAPWNNMDGVFSKNGVALVLTLARYFNRWSLWSKDIVVLITSDARVGPQAWVQAYHDQHLPDGIASLPRKSGAIQAAIAIDYALHNNFQGLHVLYDGVNGQLSNLDLVNTATHIAQVQMNTPVAMQRMWSHNNKYKPRLQTMLRGMLSQAIGRASGPHSTFIPYHIDAVTLQVVGMGELDEMIMGRIVESLFRSINNILEHLHQSFFLYIMMHPDRFVSIGTYLPSAMLVAASFSIMAIALWVRSGRPTTSRPFASPVEQIFGSSEKVKSHQSDEADPTQQPRTLRSGKSLPLVETTESPDSNEHQEMLLVQVNDMQAVVPKEMLDTAQRPLLLPIALLAAAHLLGMVPLFITSHLPAKMTSTTILSSLWLLSCFIPLLTASQLRGHWSLQDQYLVQCFSLLILGMLLATLATLNFSLSLFIGLLASPACFVGRSLSARDDSNDDDKYDIRQRIISSFILQLFSPVAVLFAITALGIATPAQVCNEAQLGWTIHGMSTTAVIWCVWWPAWLLASTICSPAGATPSSSSNSEKRPS